MKGKKIKKVLIAVAMVLLVATIVFFILELTLDNETFSVFYRHFTGIVSLFVIIMCIVGLAQWADKNKHKDKDERKVDKDEKATLITKTSPQVTPTPTETAPTHGPEEDC